MRGDKQIAGLRTRVHSKAEKAMKSSARLDATTRESARSRREVLLTGLSDHRGDQLEVDPLHGEMHVVTRVASSGISVRRRRSLSRTLTLFCTALSIASWSHKVYA
jgi:hypothetical protein